ncbi:hypothetical protein PF008_g6831 [Phytophthora fragariae]|uniref:Timeless N-terminal domain-containing protein n=1 Tax=Phytophthora fragariae TaxID=53985 RepID=A0A6G0S4I8_9STRA|nr:hypothetical protein PF008_g6831 [Phytophthora fragariae]
MIFLNLISLIFDATPTINLTASKNELKQNAFSLLFLLLDFFQDQHKMRQHLSFRLRYCAPPSNFFLKK